MHLLSYPNGFAQVGFIGIFFIGTLGKISALKGVASL